MKTKVDRLLENDFIRKGQYKVWVCIPIIVPKSKEKLLTCQDLTCFKDSFSLHRIDQFVDATIRHDLLSFMGAYSRYNQIPIYGLDEEHTAFIMDLGSYCYKLMPFELNNC